MTNRETAFRSRDATRTPPPDAGSLSHRDNLISGPPQWPPFRDGKTPIAADPTTRFGQCLVVPCLVPGWAVCACRGHPGLPSLPCPPPNLRKSPRIRRGGRDLVGFKVQPTQAAGCLLDAHWREGGEREGFGCQVRVGDAAVRPGLVPPPLPLGFPWCRICMKSEWIGLCQLQAQFKMEPAGMDGVLVNAYTSAQVASFFRALGQKTVRAGLPAWVCRVCGAWSCPGRVGFKRVWAVVGAGGATKALRIPWPCAKEVRVSGSVGTERKVRKKTEIGWRN